MLDTEYNEAEVNEAFKEEGRVEGRAEGRAEGRNEERSDSIESMLSRGKTVEEIVDFCNYPYDQVKRIEDMMLATAK